MISLPLPARGERVGVRGLSAGLILHRLQRHYGDRAAQNRGEAPSPVASLPDLPPRQGAKRWLLPGTMNQTAVRQPPCAQRLGNLRLAATRSLDARCPKIIMEARNKTMRQPHCLIRMAIGLDQQPECMFCPLRRIDFLGAIKVL